MVKIALQKEPIYYYRKIYNYKSYKKKRQKLKNRKSFVFIEYIFRQILNHDKLLLHDYL